MAVADRALYLAKPRRARLANQDPTRDLYLAAVDQTTLKLLERLEPSELLAEIVERAAGLVGVAHGFLYLLEDGPEGELDLVDRVGTGAFDEFAGYRLPRGKGVGWAVVRSGRAGRRRRVRRRTRSGCRTCAARPVRRDAAPCRSPRATRCWG